MELQISSPSKEQRPKPTLFHISQSLFRNRRLKRRLSGKRKRKSPKKKQKARPRQMPNGKRPVFAHTSSEVVEILSTDEEAEEPAELHKVETSIVLSSDEEDEQTTQTRIFPMLTSETTVQTAVGNTVYELSLTQLKENLEMISMSEKKMKSAPASVRLSTAEISISLLSDDEEDNKDPLSTSGDGKAHALL